MRFIFVLILLKSLRFVKSIRLPYIMTSSKHKNGTERIAEASMQFTNIKYFVDIQGDEPLINPKHIDNVIDYHEKSSYDIILPHIQYKRCTLSDTYCAKL